MKWKNRFQAFAFKMQLIPLHHGDGGGGGGGGGSKGGEKNRNPGGVLGMHVRRGDSCKFDRYCPPLNISYHKAGAVHVDSP
jgi:hypothetical protein